MLRQFLNVYRIRGDGQMSHPFWREAHQEARSATAPFYAAAATLVRLAVSDDPDHLWVACRDGDLPCIQAMLEKGVDINHANRHAFGASGMMAAAEMGRLPVVRVLCEKGAAVDATEGAGWTALMGSAMNGHEQVRTFPGIIRPHFPD